MSRRRSKDDNVSDIAGLSYQTIPRGSWDFQIIHAFFSKETVEFFPYEGANDPPPPPNMTLAHAIGNKLIIRSLVVGGFARSPVRRPTKQGGGGGEAVAKILPGLTKLPF